MGRRMKSTKSGKYINPTDQARKEARKRELKKNKKQRLIVRVAVLKGKDPQQIITDWERLDRIEYDFYNPPTLNEKVLKDKRRKLKDTWDRLLRLYIKEDKDKYLELKRLESEYNQRRSELIRQYEAIKSAQEVDLDEIPLPSSTTAPSLPSSADHQSNSSGDKPIQSILKSKTPTKRPPGCPPGLPPLIEDYLSDLDDLDDNDDSSADDDQEPKTKRIKFADQIDDPRSKNESDLHKFLQEIEQLSSTEPKSAAKNTDPPSSTTTPSATVPPGSITLSTSTLAQPSPQIVVRSSLPEPPSQLPHQPPVQHPPVQLQMPIMHKPGQVLRVSNQSMNPINPPPPPSTFPPSYPHQISHNKKDNQKHSKPTSHQPQQTTIEARPQLRNLSADSTKFLPLALRIKREDKQVSSSSAISSSNRLKSSVKSSSANDHRTYGMVKMDSTSSTLSTTATSAKIASTNSKDDAYEQFMKEMNGLL